MPICTSSTRAARAGALEEGIVKTGSFSIDQGVGVRAVSGEKTAFAYSDDISLASLLDAARTVRAISSVAQTGRVRVPAKKIATSRSLYQGVDPIASLDSTAKVAPAGAPGAARSRQGPPRRAGDGGPGQ